MNICLWHFTGRVEDARQIQAGGFREFSEGLWGLRWPCFSLAGERNWEPVWGPALVEVSLEIDEQELASYEQGGVGVSASRGLPLCYQIPPEVVNARTVRRQAHDNADHLPRTSEEYSAALLSIGDIAGVMLIGAPAPMDRPLEP